MAWTWTCEPQMCAVRVLLHVVCGSRGMEEEEEGVQARATLLGEEKI